MKTSPDFLYFDKPAENWENCLPLGNGRLGAMIKGVSDHECFYLNDENIWSGGPMNRINSSTQKYMEQIRSFMNAGQVQKAQNLALKAMSSTSNSMRVYQTAGECHIDFDISGKVTAYTRSLDLSKACATVIYKDEADVTFTRTAYISAVDDIFVIHVKADKNGKVSFCAKLDRPVLIDRVFSDNEALYLEDSHSIPFCTGVSAVIKGGKKEIIGTSLCVQNADEALIFIAIKSFDKFDAAECPDTQFEYNKMICNNFWTERCRSQLAEICTKAEQALPDQSFDEFCKQLFDRHVNEYQKLYGRMSFAIGRKSSCDCAEISSETTDRLLQIGSSEYSSELFPLLLHQYCNFSRYLLISSSRTPGRHPANLQGVWNNSLNPPWGSKYTININLEMNYWCACMCNIAECEMPVFDLLERAYSKGVLAARELYGCNGYVMHHNTDIWGDAAPQDEYIPATYWQLGGAWLATHIYEHFEYTLDFNFLARYYYLLHEACIFFSEFLQNSNQMAPDGKPYLVLNPSESPENTYKAADGSDGMFCIGCTMDNMILRHLFESCLSALKLLDSSAKNKNGNSYETEDKKRFEYVLTHLKKTSLNSDGSIMEWNEEFEEVEPGHRHVSHLYGLFPGHSISIDKTPELADGAKKTLKKRLRAGGGHTGWSQAWIINLRAALRQGNEAFESIVKLFSHSTLPNLLDNHPPFQIDGNFGALAGVMRMLAQSELVFDLEGKPYAQIVLLPALPDASSWQSGFVRGLRVKGGLFIDFEWSDGKVTDYRVYGSSTEFSLVK